MHCKVWISALCSLLLSLGLLHTTKALQPWESKPWLSLYTPPQRLRLLDGLRSLEDALEDAPGDTLEGTVGDGDTDSQEDFLPWDEEEEAEEDSVSDGRDHMAIASGGKTFAESGMKRRKRVFLSRGWMAGGYKAPSPSPNRFVRRPPALVPSPARFTQPKPGVGPGEAHYAALVSDQPQQSPPFRRFHSIFTSGMWTPLGKRSRGGLLQV